MIPHHSHIPKQSKTLLMLGALGVVFGDIGTSPLYALKLCFTSAAHPLALDVTNILGVLSLIFWSLTMIVSIKYILFVMRADNHGEGGILALMALALRAVKNNPRAEWWITVLALFGAALFYGDAMLTPAISVLSAVEGLEILAPSLATFILPITIILIIFLFMLQKFGTKNISKVFSPIIFLWFFVLALTGFLSILNNPVVIKAILPIYAIEFFYFHQGIGFVVLGSIFLTLTGVEALYADMGHFGKAPIRRAWFFIVFPALMLNYFGQGSLLISDPSAIARPFFLLVPNWALLPLVILAACATVIASQAVISGAFSMTQQAIHLGFCPRVLILHTSVRSRGQIYIPAISNFLLVSIICLVLMFKSSENLGAAYGIAVSLTMLVTTLLSAQVARKIKEVNKIFLIGLFSFFIVLDLLFVSSSAMKIFAGGLFPLGMGLLFFTLLTTWKRGREIVSKYASREDISLIDFLEKIKDELPVRVPGTAIYMSRGQTGVPRVLLQNLKHNKVLHKQLVILTLIITKSPYIPLTKRIHLEKLGQGFYRINAYYGFMQNPDVPRLLDLCQPLGLIINKKEKTYFLSREIIVPTAIPNMSLWREKLFSFMSRNTISASAALKIPTNQVLELGTQIEI